MDKLTEDNLHQHLHMHADTNEKQLDNLKFLARYVIKQMP